MELILLIIIVILLGYLVFVRPTFFGADLQALVDQLCMDMHATQQHVVQQINSILTEAGATPDQITTMWLELKMASDIRMAMKPGEFEPMSLGDIYEIRERTLGKDIHEKLVDAGW